MNTLNNLDTALDALSKGIAPIPCYPGRKIPMESWKRWQDELPPEPLVRLWFRDRRVNIAVICTGAVVFDVDNPALLELVLQECGDTPEKVCTPSGGLHLIYRARMGVVMQNQVKIKGMDIDIRTNGGLRMLPPSETPDGKYEWIEGKLTPIAELPVARIGWTREKKRRVTMPLEPPSADASERIRRAWGYVATIEGAISGQGGHRKAMRVAGVLIQKFGLTIAEAFPIFMAWSAVCEPPWSEKEAMHKLQEAERLKGTAKALK